MPVPIIAQHGGAAAAAAAAVIIANNNAARDRELREFVANYRHDGASDHDRQRYVEAVGVLYPKAEKELDAAVHWPLKLLGVFIVMLFLLPAVGAAIGWFVKGDAEDGATAGGMIFVALMAAVFLTWVFGFGVYLILF